MPRLSTDQTGTPVSSIPNLGPASEAAFARAGITSAGQLRALGADEACLRLLKSGSSPHFIGYYVIVMGLQGRPWNDCKGAEKAALRKTFDALKASVPRQGRTRLEAALNFLGVVEKPAPKQAPLPPPHFLTAIAPPQAAAGGRGRAESPRSRGR